VRLLLDTHVFLWWISEDARLPVRARSQIASARNDVFLSAVSAWEIVAKAAPGRLELPEPPQRFIPAQLMSNGFEPLPLSLTHALAVAQLPDHHRDPFDRLLVAQAIVESIPIVTSDKTIARYPIKVVR
jgi:PIN domain nuclease of toxin-antitoxin system